MAQGAARIALYPILLAVALVAELFVTSGVSPLVIVRSLIVAIAAGELDDVLVIAARLGPVTRPWR